MLFEVMQAGAGLARSRAQADRRGSRMKASDRPGWPAGDEDMVIGVSATRTDLWVMDQGRLDARVQGHDSCPEVMVSAPSLPVLTLTVVARSAYSKQRPSTSIPVSSTSTGA